MPSLATAEWLLAPATQAVLGFLGDNGFDARVVGGAVRNALLGRAVGEIDIATTAKPEQVIASAKALGIKTIPTGIEHGTVTVLIKGKSFEVTTLRRDVVTDGRHATVAFTDDWAEDASRRDLTLNALYCDASGAISDPLGGIDDVLARRVRFIGDARARIREDYLRILRFFRFTAEYSDGAPDQAGLDASLAERHGLLALSAERVRAELVRLLIAPRAVPTIAAMVGHGLLTALLPIAPRLGIFANLVAIEATNSLSPNAPLRLATLTVAVSEDATRLADHLRLSTAERNVLVRSANSQRLDPMSDDRSLRAKLYRMSETSFAEASLLSWAASSQRPDSLQWKRLLNFNHRWQSPVCPISGKDIMARGVAPGPHVGEVLREFESWWITNDFPSERSLLDDQLGILLQRNGLHFF